MIKNYDLGFKIMFRFRFFIISTIVWLAFVLNLEAILNNLEIAIHIQRFVYVIAISTVVSMMLFLKLHEYQSSVAVSTLVLVYAIGKVLFPSTIDFTVVAMELGLVIGTYFVTRPVTNWLDTYSNNIKKAVFSPTNTLIKDNHHNVAAIERKINLARRFDRELSLLYIPMGEKLDSVNDIKSMALQAHINNLLNVLVGDTCLYAWHEGNLMVCLQGDAVEHVDTIAAQFSSMIADILKMQVELGLANFPTQGLILDDLIDTAQQTLGQPIRIEQNSETIPFFPKPARVAQTISA